MHFEESQCRFNGWVYLSEGFIANLYHVFLLASVNMININRCELFMTGSLCDILYGDKATIWGEQLTD